MNLAITGSLENSIGISELVLKELEKDIHTIQNSQEVGGQKRVRGHFASVPEMLETIVEESLQRLREHNKVSSAHDMSSWNVFIVTKKDLTICEYPVKGLQRKRLDMEHDQANLLRNEFSQGHLCNHVEPG